MLIRLPVISNVKDVADYQLCTGCGACSYLSPDNIQMIDAMEYGRRPIVRENEQGSHAATQAMSVCPGIELKHTFDEDDAALHRSLRSAWGPVYGVWEGHAGDAAIRHGGSSGGAASALSLFCLEHAGMYGVLHTAAKADTPYLNETVMSRTREELLARTGSRYAPASPCDGLAQIEAAPAPCVFIGKPCDVAAVQKVRRLRPGLDAKIGLTIAFFCAGTPSTRGTLDLLRKVGVEDPAQLTSLRYRGNGWPGRWTADWRSADGMKHNASLSYEESWDFLQRYRQWRCYICPDHTGEFADVAVGDAWHKAPKDREPGRSLIVARTMRGRQVIEAAAANGYLMLTNEDDQLLPRSQPNLLRSRGRLWGQLLALRITMSPRPTFQGFTTLVWWTRLSVKQMLQSTLGTVRRVWFKRLRTPVRDPIHGITNGSRH